MADSLSPEARSHLMSLIRGKDTGPEITARRILHRAGFRFRLHKKGLPGHPDIVLPKWRCVVFVQGCFWHQHTGCHAARIPRSRHDYWLAKLSRNVERDRRERDELVASGWRVLWLWECSMRNREELTRLADFLPGWVLYGTAPLTEYPPPAGL